MRITSLHIGGLVAIGFDKSGKYLLAVSHSGRGVFDMKTWSRIARDPTMAYPENNISIGIGPFEGEWISVIELNSDETLRALSPDGKLLFNYESGVVEVSDTVSA